MSYKGEPSLFTVFISGKERPALNKSGSSSVCLTPVAGGGCDGSNDSSPEVLTDQLPSGSYTIITCQGDFKVSVDCDGSKDFVNLRIFLLTARRKRKEVFIPKLSIVGELLVPLYKMFSMLIMRV